MTYVTDVVFTYCFLHDGLWSRRVYSVIGYGVACRVAAWNIGRGGRRALKKKG